MFADQLDVGFLDDPGSLHRVTSGVKSVDFSFLDNELFSAGTEFDDACGIYSESEDYSRMLFEWQQHIGLIGSDLVDFDYPLSGASFKDSQYVPSGDSSNTKDFAALEADDLDSLLTQFEASQAADWLLSDCVPSLDPLSTKQTDKFNCGIAVEHSESSNVVEEVIVAADDDAEYIDVEEIGEEEVVVDCETANDAVVENPVEQTFVTLDHDYCLVISADDSELDIKEDNSGDGLYNKIPSYYHETVLLRGNICLSPTPENVVEEIIIVDDSPASPLAAATSDNGLYCRLPPYIAESLPAKSDCSADDMIKHSSSTGYIIKSRLAPSAYTSGSLQSILHINTNITPDPVKKDECLERVMDVSVGNIQVANGTSVTISVQDDDATISTQDDDATSNQPPDSPKTYHSNDEYCRYYERKSRQRHRHHRERRSRYNRYSSSRSPTRSRSSRSRSSSSLSSKSRSRSRSWDRSRSRSRSTSSRSYRSRSSSSRLEDKEERLREWRMNKMRPIEERRIIYVGNISSGTTRNDLRRRFSVFGPIEEVTVHFRDHGDDYGFVTFLYKVDAFEALAHGNDDRTQPQYDLCFGGRRHFCQSRYADLDGLNAVEDDGFSNPPPQALKKPVESDFDAMLRAAQASRKPKLQKGHS